MTAFGYAASDVRANGSFKGPRIVSIGGQRPRVSRRGDDPWRDRPARSRPADRVRPPRFRHECRFASAAKVGQSAATRRAAVARRLPRQGEWRSAQRLGHFQSVSGRRRNDCCGHGRRSRHGRAAVVVRGQGNGTRDGCQAPGQRTRHRRAGRRSLRRAGERSLRPARIRDVARRADPVCERLAHRLVDVGHSRAGDDVQDRHRRRSADCRGEGRVRPAQPGRHHGP